ncbi:MAG: hypothetical protein WCR01_01345 [Bacteroidota bacterium]
MKTKKLVFKFATAGMLLILVLLFIVSCKKKDDTPEPPSPTPTPTQKDVFTDEKLNLMSDFEINNHMSFQAAGMYKHVRQGLGGPLDWFEKAFGIFSAIKDYQNSQYMNQQIADIDKSLGQIQTEIGTLQSTLNALTAELQFDMNELLTAVYQSSLNNAITPIITANGTADYNGFRWYANQAKSHNSGSPEDVAFINGELNGYMNDFAIRYTSGINNTTLQNAITALNLLIAPTTTTPGILTILSRNIVAKQSAASPMSQYMVLENYFMQIISYQFQAGVVQLNCFKINDSINLPSFSAYMDSTLTSEVQLFLQTVNFMALSLYDYRNQAQYTKDLEYLYTGISPDSNTGPMMGRAQFVANMIYDACGLPAPVMCGSIILPNYYNAGKGATPLGAFSLTAGGKTFAPNTDTLIKSPFPYTYWNMASDNTGTSSFSWDNKWRVFNYGDYGIADTGWSCTSQTLKIPATSWGNTATPQGAITPLWYNPHDPSKTSTKKTDSCTLQFAYFAASWKWGYMGPCLAGANLRTTNAMTYRYNGYWGCYSAPTCPFVTQWHGNVCKFESSGGNAYIANNGGRLFQENFFGDFGTYSSGWIYAAEFTYFNSEPGNDLGSGLNLYINYDYTLTSGWSTGFYFADIDIGTGIQMGANVPTECQNSGFKSTADILSNYTGEMTGQLSGSASLIKPVSIVTQRLSFDIILGMHDLTSSTGFNTKTNIYAQYVYGGRTTNY